jgi:hypothetical protein
MSNETVPQDATAKSDALKAEANSLFAGRITIKFIPSSQLVAGD